VVNRRPAILFTLLAAATLALLAWPLTPSKTPRTSGPLASAFYVWQRHWDAPVRDAVRSIPPSVDGLAPLCAEITWPSDPTPAVAWPDLDPAALRATHRPISAVLRIARRTPTVSSQSEICRIAREVLARLRAGNIAPAELQIDFDCAESQLPGYRAWLAALRTAVAPLPVRPTVLPSWLARPEFAALARECGAYILQVHATTRPKLDALETALCETADARRWVEQAARLGVPFRVALPTYTYRVAFAPDGRLLDIEAEGAPRAWPAATLFRAFRPDPAQVAALIHDWTRDRPAALTGLLWYRLPVATDTQNWRWPTLAAVLQGRAPQAVLRVEKSGASPIDLALLNAGESDAAFPSRIVVKSAAPIEAADGIGGYRAEIAGREVTFLRAAELAPARLSPGTRLPLGWLRAAPDPQIEIITP
jgi:hypothetical protein